MKDEEIALMNQLLAQVRLARRRGSPTIAPFASKLELEFIGRVRDMESEKARLETPELALAGGGQHREEAA